MAHADVEPAAVVLGTDEESALEIDERVGVAEALHDRRPQRLGEGDHGERVAQLGRQAGELIGDQRLDGDIGRGGGEVGMGEHRRREQGVAERELPQLLDHLVGEGLAEHRFGELRRRRPVERRHVDVTAEVLVPEQGDGRVDDRHVAVRGDQDRGAGSDELRDERRRGSVEQVHVVEPEHEPSSADAFGDRLAGGDDHRHALAGDRVGEQRHEDTEGSAGAGGAAAEEGRRMAAPRQLEHDLLDEPALAVAGDAVEHGADPVLGIADGGSEQPVASHEWRAGAGAGEPQRLGVDRGGGCRPARPRGRQPRRQSSARGRRAARLRAT